MASTIVSPASRPSRRPSDYSYAVASIVVLAAVEFANGVNIENAAYPVTVCGERTAIFKAVSNGERKFKAIAVVTRDGGMPCGSCQQVMAEFSPDMLVILADESGNIKTEKILSDLLPGAFGAGSLK